MGFKVSSALLQLYVNKLINHFSFYSIYYPLEIPPGELNDSCVKAIVRLP